MTARALPTAPAWTTLQEITSAQLNQISTYLSFLASPPCFRAEQQTSQTVATATNTQITCETTVHDSDGGLSTSAPYSYVVPYAGIWDFDGGVGYVPNATGERVTMIWANGVHIDGASPVTSQFAGVSLSLTTATGIPCNVGDVIGLYTYQTSGAGLATASAGANNGQYSWLAGRLVSLQTP